MPRATVNGTELYYEVLGTGPPVLLIMGATGDGGHFDAIADLLADEFTVITYDRRGNGRSPAPPGWQTTSAEEQADDAAALLDALETGPAAAFGTSSGGTFALCLLVRHPEAVRGDDPARAGPLRSGRRLRRRSGTHKGLGPGSEEGRRAVLRGRAVLVLHSRERRRLEPARACAS
jgi:pimeloyl-ACP methyl ester carboxylesterase